MVDDQQDRAPAGSPLAGLRTSEQVAGLLNVPYRSLMRWVVDGLVEPYAIGRGNPARLWSEKHVREVRIIARLRGEGVSMQKLKKVAEFLRARGDNPFSSGEFLVLEPGGEMVKVYASGEIVELLKNPGQRLLLVMGLEETAE